MILKYQVKDSWGFIGNVSRVINQELDIDDLVSRYDTQPKGENPDPTEYMEGKKLPENIVKTQKAFSMAIMDLSEDAPFERHSENLLDENSLGYSAAAILIKLADKDDFDSVIVTNHAAYLLNDKGQTIERLN